MKTKIKNLFLKWLKKCGCPRRLSLSICIGIFIALSPYMGFHTIMSILFAWLLGLNYGITFLVSHLNNVFTVGPLLIAEYGVGKWLMRFFGLGQWLHNPQWASCINSKLTSFCGLPDISLWAFFVGANVLAVVVSVALYPVMRMVFKRLAATKVH